jgi:uncharacterized protein (TIGR02186 family)
MIRLALLFLLLAAPARAEEIVLGLSQDQVAITATFQGSNILVFGAIKRDSPAPQGVQGIIVTVAGPDAPVTVRRKSRQFGIWINSDSVDIDAAPSFYAVATSGPLREVLSDTSDLRARVTIPRAIRSVGARVSDSSNFTDALIRIRAANDLYQVLEGGVDFEEDTLFRTSIRLPSNLTEGEYKARILLTRDGRIVDEYDTTIPVKKVGVERWLYNLAHVQAAVYGAMSLIIAVGAGWGASLIFERLRR